MAPDMQVPDVFSWWGVCPPSFEVVRDEDYGCLSQELRMSDVAWLQD